MDTQEKILNAANKLFGEEGFDATTTREIAELSGVNKALIHYHFESKEALFESILDRYYENLTRVLQEALQTDGNVQDKIANLIDNYVDFLVENRNFLGTVQREASGGKRVDRVRAHMVPIFQMGMKLIQGAYPETRTGEMAASHLLTSFYGMIISYFTYSDVLEHLLGKDPLSKKELEMRKKHLRWMLDIVVKAISE